MLKYNGWMWSVTPFGEAYILEFRYRNKLNYEVFASLEAVAAYIEDNQDSIKGKFKLLEGSC